MLGLLVLVATVVACGGQKADTSVPRTATPASTPVGTPTATPEGPPYGRQMHDGVLLINWGWSSPEPATPAQFADAIVQGRVVSVGEPRWTTPDGERPPGFADNRLLSGDYTIYDRAVVEVSRVIAGEGVPESIAVTSWGGRRDGVSAFNIDIGPVFAPDQEVVLFLHEPGKDLFLPRENWSVLQAYQVFGDTAWHGDAPYVPLVELIAAIGAARAVPVNEREYEPGWRFPSTTSTELAAVFSDAIVRGVVTEVGGARWSTPDGRAPEGYDPHNGLSGSNEFIHETARVEIRETIDGRAVRGTIDVASFGGSVDGLAWPPTHDRSGYPYGPQFAAGEEVILFLVEPGTPLVRPNEHWMAIMDWRVDGDLAVNEFMMTLPQLRGESAIKVDDLVSEARHARAIAVPPVE